MSRVTLKEFSQLVSNLRIKAQGASTFKNKYKDQNFTGANKPEGYADDEEFTRILKIGPVIDELLEGLETVEGEIEEIHKYIEGQLGRDADKMKLPPNLTFIDGDKEYNIISFNEQEGTTEVRADEVYVGANSLYVNNKRVIEDESDTINITTDKDQNLKVKTTSTGILQLTSEEGGIQFTSEGNTTFNSDITVNSSNSISGSNATTGLQLGKTRVNADLIMSGDIVLSGQSKIAFGGDKTNSFIAANTDSPEDIEVHADQDVILRPDRNVVVGDTNVINKDGDWIGNPTGLRGADGTSGSSGSSGTSGSSGSSGTSGSSGSSGTSGTSGSSGRDGVDGATGTSGTSGSSGSSGTSGSSGSSGTSGSSGSSGTSGSSGSSGSSGTGFSTISNPAQNRVLISDGSSNSAEANQNLLIEQIEPENNPTAIIKNNRRVGINTNDPQVVLDVNGLTFIRENLLVSNNLGIGTDSPGEKLDVSGNISVSGTVDGRNISSDGAKLDGIESNAKDDQTISAGSGLAGGGTGNVTISHDDTSSQGSVNNGGGTVIQDISLDTFGHTTNINSVNLDNRYDNYNGWDLFIDQDLKNRINSGENVDFIGGSNVTLEYSTDNNNTIVINSTDTNTNDIDYISGVSLSGSTLNFSSVGSAFGGSVDLSSLLDDTNIFLTGLSFNTGNGVLTATLNNGNTVTEDLDGRYLTGFTETDTLQSVTDRGNTTTNNIGINTTNTSQALNINGRININDGGNSVFVGEGAGLNDNTSIKSNVGVGSEALRDNTSGRLNTATGSRALFNNTTGEGNTASGQGALQFNTTGNFNLAIGPGALFDTTIGSFNTAIGHYAGRSIPNLNPNQTGNNSVFLGFDTRANADGQTNQNVIGYAARGLGSNTVVLGNSDIETTALRGNVGIGTTSPNNKLHVDGGIDANTLNTGQGDNELYAMNQNVRTSDKVAFNQVETTLLKTGNGTQLKLQAGEMNLSSIDTGEIVYIGGESGVKVFSSNSNSGDPDNSNTLIDTSGNAQFNGNISVSGTVDGRNISSDGAKLDGIESNAKDDQTISAGSGLTGGGTGNVTISHDDTSSQGSVNNGGGTVIQDISLDTFGHTTNINSVNLDSRYDNYNGWDLLTDSTSRGRITSGENINFIGGSNVTLEYSSTNNTITINSTDTNTDTNTFLNGLSFNTGNGVLTATLNDNSTETVDLDGRYLTSESDTLDSVTNRGGSTTNDVEFGTISGNGSGLTNVDAETLDGINSSQFLRSDTADTFTTLSGTEINIGSGVELRESSDRADLLQIRSSTSSWSGLQILNSSDVGRFSFMTDGLQAGIYDDANNEWLIKFNENSSVELYHNGNEKLQTTPSGVDVVGNLSAYTLSGNGSGLGNVDAETLDGINSSQFLRSDANDTMNGQLDMNGNRITNVDDLFIQDKIYHDGDTNTFIQFAGDRIEFDTGGSERMEINDSRIHMRRPLDMNNNDIQGVDQIFHHGDTNTYIQFHSSDQFRVVTGGSERLEVNNSGLNISNNITLDGDINLANSSISNQQNTNVDTGGETIAQVPSDNDGAFFDYIVKNGSNLRAGTVMAVHDGTDVSFTETSTQDLGDTSQVELSVDLSSGNLRLRANTETNNWTVKALVRTM